MSSRCTICGRADRSAVDADLASGVGSLATIAARYGLSKTSLIRHRDRHIAENLHPVSNTAAENRPLRIHHRARPIVAEPVPDHCEAAAPDDAEIIPGPCENIEPSVARLREVANMLARGLSRAEIAEHYGVHVDTVSVWHRTIRERGILRVKSTTAAQIIATLFHNQAQRTAALWAVAHDARDKGLPRVAVAALDGIRKEDRHVFDIAEGIGVFDHFKLTPEEASESRPSFISTQGKAELAFMADAIAGMDESERGDFAREYRAMQERVSSTDPAELRAHFEVEASAEPIPQDDEPLF